MKQSVRAAMFAFYVIGAALLTPVYWALGDDSFRGCCGKQWDEGLKILLRRK